jgi:hypothetical protein
MRQGLPRMIKSKKSFLPGHLSFQNQLTFTSRRIVSEVRACILDTRVELARWLRATSQTAAFTRCSCDTSASRRMARFHRSLVDILRGGVRDCQSDSIRSADFQSTVSQNFILQVLRSSGVFRIFIPLQITICETAEYNSALLLRAIGLCLPFYAQKIHSSSRADIGAVDPWECKRWFERLPLYSPVDPKRAKAARALEKPLEEFSNKSKRLSCDIVRGEMPPFNKGSKEIPCRSIHLD